MKITQLLGLRFKETPSECQTVSHTFMMRGGYIKNVGAGLFSFFTPAKRIASKIENIIREEMNAIDGQEVLFPVVMPAALWRESGRYDAIGSELARFRDRGENEMVLGMTHEEAAVHLARDTAGSYTNYPFMIYQIQTKFRDEPRARAGLIRVREFTMKDAYSFHTSMEDLEDYYARCHKAYERIFARAGVPQVISVKSDTGMMGGKVAHEFMLLTDIGEDSLVICPDCTFSANMEVAEVITTNAPRADEPLTKIATPDTKSIEDLSTFLKVKSSDICKAVVYRRNSDDHIIVVFIRGDLEVNETKLRNYLHYEVHPAVDLRPDELHAGFIGPVGQVGVDGTKVTVIFDRSLSGAHNLVCGANEDGYHYTGYTPEVAVGHDIDAPELAKAYEGGVCPLCGKSHLKISRGVEVGNIFQLGTKYSKSMNMQYVDRDGALQYPIMGCYGIGVGRLMASVCEVCHDNYGPIWPMSIAPWQAHICAIRADNPEVAGAANALYDALTAAGVEVILDDRNVSAGIMFSDADLLGVPVRVIVSPKTLSRGAIEITARDKSFTFDAPIDTAADAVRTKVRELKNISK